MKHNPFLTESDLERLSIPTQAEIESLRRQNPELAERLFGPVSYDNGVNAAGLSGVGL